MSAPKYNASATTGTFDTLVAGSVVAGARVNVNDGVRNKVSGLSALVTVDAETDTITLTAFWQISNDATTWVRCAGAPNNPADVVLATGTAGADAAVTRVIPAPDSVYGAKFARCVLTNGVVTGAAVDTYSIGYNYRDPSFDG